MKKILLPLLILLVTFGFAQTTNKGAPKSWSIATNKSVAKIEMPAIDIQRIVEQDAINDKKQGTAYRIGILSEINYNLNSAGVWTDLPNGDRFWRFNISSKDALHLSVNFNDFYIPNGASLYLYNNDKSDLLGAYTSDNNSDSKILGSWFVDGDNLWIEYLEPKEVKGLGSLNIYEIIHGYRLGKQHQVFAEQQKALNDSGDCNQDVDCFVGADFEDKKNVLKHSIAFLNMANGYICSGGLVNNVNNDNTPYFLTANHCYTDPDGVSSNPAQYSMRFNWITAGTPRCAVTTNSSDSSFNTVNGSILRARNAGSDFMLVEITGTINPTWDLIYAGWDRSDTNPDFEVGIHHPSGDIMKVCRDDTGAIKGNNNGAATWQVTTSGGGWELGVTEGGSSGSPLFDQDGRVIGQLFGGAALCVGTNDNNQIDYYGRFATSWNSGSSSTRLKDWLDPDNTGATFVNSIDNTASVNDSFLEENISVYPNPTKGLLTIDLGNLTGNYTLKVLNFLGQEVISSKINSELTDINLSRLNSNIYFVKISDTNNNSLVKKIILNK